MTPIKKAVAGSFLVMILFVIFHVERPDAAVSGGSEFSGTFNVRAYGARGDGTALDTRAIQSAVDACGKKGGEVLFPPGTYRSGTIELRSHVTLRLMRGAVLSGSTDLKDYIEKVPSVRSYTDKYVKRSLIFGDGLEDVGISGEGTIDGNGAAPQFKVNDYYRRPYVIRLVACKGVGISGVTLRNSPMWMQLYLACENVTVSGIRVFNHGNRNNDMIDFDGCRNVTMTGCIGDTDDDGITIKSTSPAASEHIAISNCVVSSHCNAIKMGTESVGGFRNIAISNCVVKPSDNKGVVYGTPDGISGIALEIVDGGVMEHITISNITIDRVGTPLFIRLGNRARKYTDDAPVPGVGSLRNVLISGITARGANATSSITGIPGHPVEGIVLRDIRLISSGAGEAKDTVRPVPENEAKYPEALMFGTKLPAYGLYIRHAKGIDLNGVTCMLDAPDIRPALVCEDVEGIGIDGLAVAPPVDAPAALFSDVRNAFMRGSRVKGDCSVFLKMEGQNTNRITLKGNDLRGISRVVEFGDGVKKGEVLIGE